MITFKLIMLIVSVVCFALGAAGVASRVVWDQAGKAFFVASFIPVG